MGFEGEIRQPEMMDVPKANPYLTETEIQLTLSQRLEQILTDKPDEYPLESISRVKQLIAFEENNPGKNKPYRIFETIEDWKLYLSIHPEWHGKSTLKLQKDRSSGGLAFYKAFTKWRKKSSANQEEFQHLLREVFISNSPIWKDFQTLEEWKREYEKHPEWHEKSRTEIKSGTDTLALASVYYYDFIKWAHATAGNNLRERERLIDEIFPRRIRSRKSFETIDNWIAEFNTHPEWHGKSTAEMQKDKKYGGDAFYQAFSKWCRDASLGDEDKRTTLIELIFPARQKNWKKLTTIEDWKMEFDRHSEWQGRSTYEMDDDVNSGGSAFYAAFSKWCKKTSQGNEKERKRLLQEIFPDKTKKAQNIISSQEADQLLESLLEDENG